MATVKTVKIEVPQNGAGMSKAEEIALLEKFAEAIPEQSYLASLFSAELRGWFQRQVRDDRYTDLFDEWNAECKRAAEAEDDLRVAQREAEELGKQLAAKERLLAELREEMARNNKREQETYDAWVKAEAKAQAAEEVVEAVGEFAKHLWLNDEKASAEQIKNCLRHAREEAARKYGGQ